ncbi:MAG: transcriptional repressor LexA [Chloroflexi bacterium]|nr:transcriptional repressor LexA [Chloroflexota bacterium]MCL5076399.1 transcriptional repressor LexA [Chloroflexota bacterium]
MSTFTSPLSTRQQRILDFIRDFLAENGYPPTIREIGDAIGISSTSAVDYNLNILERKGYIRRDPEISRGISFITDSAKHLPSALINVPIVGRIAAGEPIEALPEHAEQVLLTRDLVPEGAYALRVKGKSMIEDLIDDGDLVVVRPQQTAENGDIVVTLLMDSPGGEGQATLKRIYWEKDRIRLQPANHTMAPLYVKPDNLIVQGKVVAVIRRL